MSSFKDQLRENAYKNTDEAKIEQLLEDLYNEIKQQCLIASNCGDRTENIYLKKCLESVINNSDIYNAEELMLKTQVMPAKYRPEEREKAINDPERIKRYLEKQFNKDGLKFEIRRERKIPLYQFSEEYVERDKSDKVLYGMSNLLFGTDYDIDTRVKRKKKQIGWQVLEIEYVIKW